MNMDKLNMLADPDMAETFYAMSSPQKMRDYRTILKVALPILLAAGVAAYYFAR